MEFNKDIIGIELRSNRSGSDNYFNALETNRLSELLKESFEESFLLSTCQRLAAFVYTEDSGDLLNFFHSIGMTASQDQLLIDSKACASYLFRVSSGTKSLILGEHEILGQLRKAHKEALEANSLGPHLDELVRSAISCGKSVRTATKVGSYQTSYASVGYDLLKRKHDETITLPILIVGTGSISESLLKILIKSGYQDISVFSHTPSRARELAAEYKIKAVFESNFMEVFASSTLVIGGTHKEIDFKPLLKNGAVCPRKEISLSGTQKLIIDYGAPANLPMMANLDGVEYYSLFQIAGLIEESLDHRKSELPHAERIIKKAINDFIRNLNQRKAAPIIGSYWNILLDIQQKEMKWLLPKMGELSPKQIDLIERYTNKMLRSISKKPIEQIKKWSENSEHKMDKMNVAKELINYSN